MGGQWAAGIGWEDDEYTVAVLDGDGGLAVSHARYPADAIGELTALLAATHARSGGQLAVVIDSVSGVVERHLVEAGLVLYRADPMVSSRRPMDRSVPAVQLAALAHTRLSSLCRLTEQDGAMSGRDDEVEQAILASADVEASLAARGRLLVAGDGSAREVALTFDDGPHPEFTPHVLEVLRRYGAVATFFCIGLNAGAHPDTLARVAADGHEIGNHTWSHPYLPDMSHGEVLRQVERTNDALSAVTGHPPTLVRPPYGARSPAVLDWLEAAGMVTVLWDVDTSDWARPGADAIAAEVAGSAGQGSVVLMHDGGGDRSQTVAALPGILDRLSGEGYRFVPVSRFLRPHPVS